MSGRARGRASSLAAGLAIMLFTALAGCGVDGDPSHPRATPADVFGGGPANISVSVPPAAGQAVR